MGSSSTRAIPEPHPKGLFYLAFTETWECAGCVYLTPVLGGMIADRWIGQRTAVVIGAVSMSAGHVAMAADQTFLVWALHAAIPALGAVALPLLGRHLAVLAGTGTRAFAPRYTETSQT